MINLTLGLTAILFSISGFAFSITCDRKPFTRPENFTLNFETVLFITHASSEFDGSNAKSGVNQTIAWARENGVKIVSLETDQNRGLNYTDACAADLTIKSHTGALDLIHYANNAAEIKDQPIEELISTALIRPDLLHNLAFTHAITIGGNYDHCESFTVADILKIWTLQGATSDLRLTYITNSLYGSSNALSELGPRDLVTLSELFVGQSSQPATFLPRFLEIQHVYNRSITYEGKLYADKFFPTTHSVDLYYNGQFVKRLQKGSTNLVLKIAFIDRISDLAR